MSHGIYAGIDIGTRGCKMLVYDIEGNIVYSASRSYTESGGKGHPKQEEWGCLHYEIF